MSDECKQLLRREFQRGYNKGMRRAWHPQFPPQPPNEIIRELMAVNLEMRNEFDNILATTDGEDEARYGPLIDRSDAAMLAVRDWLMQEVDKKSEDHSTESVKSS